MNRPIDMEECYREAASRNFNWALTLFVLACIGWVCAFNLDQEVTHDRELLGKINDQVIQQGGNTGNFWDWVASQKSPL
jgi:hypothetical protein